MAAGQVATAPGRRWRRRDTPDHGPLRRHPPGESAAATTDRRVPIHSAPARYERPRNTRRLHALVLMSNSRAAGLLDPKAAARPPMRKD
jgi:hypothetical protein